MRAPHLPPKLRIPWQFRDKNPTPIGIAFIAVLALLVFLALNIQKLPFIGGTPYSAAFAEAGGLKPGDRVRIAGIDVGKVDGVALQGDHVKVSFTLSGSQQLGDQVSASIEIFTLLGNKYLALHPAGTGKWSAAREIPLSRTQSPYDVTTAFVDLTNTVKQVDVGQLAQSFRTLAATFKGTPPVVHDMLSGLSRLSMTIASRDNALGQLLQHAAGVTGVLADRRSQLVTLMTDGDQLLQMLNERRAVVAQLLKDTTAVSQQLVGLVHDDERTLAPMLTHLKSVVEVLNNDQNDLDQTIKELFVWTRNDVASIGTGPWFDGTMINAFNPYQAKNFQIPAAVSVPKTFGELLRIPTGVRK